MNKCRLAESPSLPSPPSLAEGKNIGLEFLKQAIAIESVSAGHQVWANSFDMVHVVGNLFFLSFVNSLTASIYITHGSEELDCWVSLVSTG